MILRERSERQDLLDPHSGRTTRKKTVRHSWQGQDILGRMAEYSVYILSNHARTLYIGVTNDLRRRMYEHRTAMKPEGFPARYHVSKLVYFETTGNVAAAIAREKQLKCWRRERKIRLIESANPAWRDLSAEWFATNQGQ